ncbi:MAG TPA: PepSY-like domain-containing protein [Parafilimonas sp.]|nr:PepSY-like domain-containing protein [Parafilimonas sp.]
MKKIFVIAVAFTAINCNAQNVPATVKAAFQKSFPGITVKKWDKEDDGYEANFAKDGKTMSATFDANGNWKETETDIKVTELPAAVSNYVKANYKGASIKEAAITETVKGKMYEAEVKGKDLLFDMQGNFVKAEED